MKSGVFRLSAAAMSAVVYLAGGLNVSEAGQRNRDDDTPRAVTNFNRAPLQQPAPAATEEPSTRGAAPSFGALFNFGSQGSRTSYSDRAATSAGSDDGSAAELSARTKVFGLERSVAPILNSRSEAALQAAVTEYEAIARQGGWGQVLVNKTVRKGAKGRAVEAIRNRLAIEGYLPRTAAAGQEFDSALEQAVASFQENYGLPITGRVDAATAKAMSVPVTARLETMRANLIRLPEYSKDLPKRYVTVNIPAAKLEAVDGGRVVSQHAVIVGKPERPSPIVASEVSEINFNPYWHAPKSIVAKDIVPEVRKHGVRKLKELQIMVLEGDYQGPEVDPSTIDWNADPESIAERYHFRQEPGGINAMASVKINFKNKFSVYMHDTPTKQLFNEGARYFSSGCVRVEDVQQLTSWILQGQDGWNLRQVQGIAKSEERLDVALQEKVGVRWVYLTAWAGPDGMVRFRDDIYGLDGTGFITGQPIGIPEEKAG
jgi:murein L,D-transpeptidase YcbB/YkuD